MHSQVARYMIFEVFRDYVSPRDSTVATRTGNSKVVQLLQSKGAAVVYWNHLKNRCFFEEEEDFNYLYTIIIFASVIGVHSLRYSRVAWHNLHCIVQIIPVR